MDILFVCKKNHLYGFSHYNRRSSGLFNSTGFVSDALNRAGICSHVVEVIDNNCIDREVSKYKPKLVVIEALWVVPEKFDVLKKLHPRVKWYIHLHSNIPFLANEGMAMKWIPRYVEKGVKIIANSKDAYDGLVGLTGRRNLFCLQNIYPAKYGKIPFRHKESINVVCFGAVRPLKNQLIQALAAIEFAKEKRKNLKFHINSTRVEQKGDPVLNNLRQLFEATPNTELVEHKWYDHEEFIGLLQGMDIGMQVSLTETFNIVAADMVSCGLPVVVSPEVSWVSGHNQADPSSLKSILKVMRKVWRNDLLIWWNQFKLWWHAKCATNDWVDWYYDQRGC